MYLSSQLAELEQSRDELRTLVVRRKGEMAETKEQLMAAEAKIQVGERDITLRYSNHTDVVNLCR